MKEFYRQTVKEVLDHVESSEAGLTSDQADHSRENVAGMSLPEERKKVSPGFSLNSTKIFWYLS